MPTPQVWDPKTYDAARRRLVPDFDAFYGTAAFVVAQTASASESASASASPRILDLGAGTGLLSEAVARCVTAPRLTLHDASASMLAVARTRLAAAAAAAGHQAEFHIGALQDPLPPGPFDAVVSALRDRKSTRLNSSHSQISYAVFCLKKKNIEYSVICYI